MCPSLYVADGAEERPLPPAPGTRAIDTLDGDRNPVMMKGFARDFSLATAANGTSRACSFVLLVALTRWLSPGDFGQYAFGWAIYLLVSQLSGGLDLGFVALARRADAVASVGEREYRRLKRMASLVVAGTAAALIAVASAAGATSPHMTLLLLAAALSGAAYGQFQVQPTCFLASGHMAKYAASMSVFQILVLIASLVLIWLGIRDPAAFVACYGGASLVMTVPSLWRRTAQIDVRTGGSRTLLKYSRWLILSSAIYGIMQRVEVVVAAGILGATQLATYAAPARFFGLIEFALASLGVVLLTRVGAISTRAESQSYFRATAVVVTLVAVVAVAAATAAEPLTELLLGPEYRESTPVVQVLCLAAVLLTTNSVLKYLLLTFDRTGQFAVMNVLLLVVKVTTALTLVPWLGAVGAAWSLVCGYAASTCFLLIVLRRGWREQPLTKGG
jgi:O-antigen/teichoic acid export membrane protein